MKFSTKQPSAKAEEFLTVTQPNKGGAAPCTNTQLWTQAVLYAYSLADDIQSRNVSNAMHKHTYTHAQMYVRSQLQLTPDGAGLGSN